MKTWGYLFTSISGHNVFILWLLKYWSFTWKISALWPNGWEFLIQQSAELFLSISNSVDTSPTDRQIPAQCLTPRLLSSFMPQKEPLTCSSPQPFFPSAPGSALNGGGKGEMSKYKRPLYLLSLLHSVSGYRRPHPCCCRLPPSWRHVSVPFGEWTHLWARSPSVAPLPPGQRPQVSDVGKRTFKSWAVRIHDKVLRSLLETAGYTSFCLWSCRRGLWVSGGHWEGR